MTAATGRPKPKPLPRRTLPPPLPDTPENVARAVLSTPPKKPEEWDYVRRDNEQADSASDDGE